MAANLIILLPAPSSSLVASISACPAPIPLPKTANLPLSYWVEGLRPFTPPPISLISCRPLPCTSAPPIKPCSPPPMTAFEFLDATAIPTCPLLLARYC
ncbi:hypothetical protein U9M48_033193 [Paspalum notatum var. saurae]|uniref:Secreted protein n=1 Tax=Paspalum notatum var. saurae TaxID=547442 RepID=A0AAQ3U9H9_PASNO